MTKNYNISEWFGANLAETLSNRIIPHFKSFDSRAYVKTISDNCDGLSYSQRVELHAVTLKRNLPEDYIEAVDIIHKTLGPTNKEETGTFKNFYWLLPFSKYVQNYGLEHCLLSLDLIEQITQRSTGEYALRPFIVKYPTVVLKRAKKWSMSNSFHLRRLASEGLRPKLPWAPKLELFIKDPEPVFEILELLKEDEVKYVKKSVANHLTDYLKLNTVPTVELMSNWLKNSNKQTQWIIKHANRKLQIQIP